jgi:iron complex transport system substrate-binding protein
VSRFATRRTACAVAALALVALAGCADGEPEPVAGPSLAGGSGTFPVTVEHVHGETTIPEQPARVVSVGLTEQDTLLQLGVTPVGVTEWYGEQPFATWPWAQDLLGDAEPTVLSTANGLEFEKIAALEPDLIIGTNAGITKKDYELLSAIAPTVTNEPGSPGYFSSWQDQTLQIARALGREDDGQALVDDVEDSYAEVAAEHPEWKGLTATFSQGAPYDGSLYVYPDGLNTDFLTELGFDITAGLEDFSPDGYQAQISGENVGAMEADVMVFATESTQQFDDLQSFGTVAHLAAVRDHRAVYTDDVLAGAIYFLTPLSLEYVLEHLTPELELAADGDAPREYPS